MTKKSRGKTQSEQLLFKNLIIVFVFFPLLVMVLLLIWGIVKWDWFYQTASKYQVIYRISSQILKTGAPVTLKNTNQACNYLVRMWGDDEIFVERPDKIQVTVTNFIQLQSDTIYYKNTSSSDFTQRSNGTWSILNVEDNTVTIERIPEKKRRDLQRYKNQVEKVEVFNRGILINRTEDSPGIFYKRGPQLEAENCNKLYPL